MIGSWGSWISQHEQLCILLVELLRRRSWKGQGGVALVTRKQFRIYMLLKVCMYVFMVRHSPSGGVEGRGGPPPRHAM